MERELLEEFESKMVGVSDAARGHEAVARMDPEYFRVIKQHFLDVTLERENSVVGRSWKELVIMSVCSSQRSWQGARIHMKRALNLGAEPRQVLEVLQAAAIPGGFPVLWNGARILDELLEELGREFR